jgi:hypothetical protein
MGVDRITPMAKARKRTDSASSTDSSAALPDPADSFSSSEQLPDESGQPYHRDRIAMRAYELYLARGGEDGGDFDDWLAAEREVAGSNGHGSGGEGEE